MCIHDTIMITITIIMIIIMIFLIMSKIIIIRTIEVNSSHIKLHL